jgi:hypothetical protein
VFKVFVSRKAEHEPENLGLAWLDMKLREQPANSGRGKVSVE